ncbi:hypothetical protein WMF11_26340 [Sorangium sp. So ce295]|uniref:hypothetical protein n=1 Tax=Sorangium sp. So ce295 TaxID=3133295 RepID=UPI003F5D6F37
MSNVTRGWFEDNAESIGRTPLLRLRRVVEGALVAGEIRLVPGAGAVYERRPSAEVAPR